MQSEPNSREMDAHLRSFLVNFLSRKRHKLPNSPVDGAPREANRSAMHCKRVIAGIIATVGNFQKKVGTAWTNGNLPEHSSRWELKGWKRGGNPRAVPQTFGAGRPVYDQNPYPPRKSEGFRVGGPIAILKPQLTRTALSEEERPVGNFVRASSNLAHESCHNSPRQGLVYGEELPIRSACGGGNIHLPSLSNTSEAIAILKYRQQQGMKIDSYMFVEILKRCLEQKDFMGRLMAARQVHECIIQSRMDKHPYVANTLLNIYVKCGRLEDARGVFDGLGKKTVATWNIMIGAYAASGNIDYARLIFDRMEKRDLITWNTLIAEYAKRGCGVEAYRLFLLMKVEGFKPDGFTYASILNAAASGAGALASWVKEVHSYALEAGLESDLRVGNALIHMYAKGGSIGDARMVFDRLKTRDVITWTTMIGAYAEGGCGLEAYRLFLRMQREGVKPNAFTYVSILNASASAAGDLEWVKEIHRHALKADLESDLRVGSALVHMYAKCGRIDDARLIFDRMENRNVITWTIMIGGLAQHGRGHEALELFRKMNADCVKPNGTSFTAVLSACCHAGLVDEGRKVFLAMAQDYAIEPTVEHYTCMVDLLGRAGKLQEAKLFIDDMPVEADGVTWKALLGACKTYGHVELGELAFKKIVQLEPEDPAAYVLLSNIYAAACDWGKVSLVRNLMQERGVRKEPGRSWVEVDDRIHEFLVGDTSHPESAEIYTELNKLTSKIKAEGYIPDTQLVLQKNIDEGDKELALCYHSEKLAITYGLMRTPPGKPIRVYKNLRVCSDCHTATKFISKVTGREIIARDANRFHHFKDGVCSCGDYW